MCGCPETCFCDICSCTCPPPMCGCLDIVSNEVCLNDTYYQLYVGPNSTDTTYCAFSFGYVLVSDSNNPGYAAQNTMTWYYQGSGFPNLTQGDVYTLPSMPVKTFQQVYYATAFNCYLDYNSFEHGTPPTGESPFYDGTSCGGSGFVFPEHAMCYNMGGSAPAPDPSTFVTITT